MKRRTFLGCLGGVTTVTLISGIIPVRSRAAISQPDGAIPTGPKPARNPIENKIRPCLQSDDPEMWRLATDTFQQCILGKLRAPESPLAHPWLTPGGNFIGQWLWDTMFVVDLLAILPDQRENIRGVFQNYWDFQNRWNPENPEFARDMVTNSIVPESAGVIGKRPYSQAPLLAWGMERVFKRNGDLEMVRPGLKRLEAFHEWYWRERDVAKTGLIGVGSYSGNVQDARYETYDYEADLDDLKMTTHPERSAGGKCYGDICIPANTAYLLLSEESLARLAETAGDKEMAARRWNRFHAGVESMRTHMWDQEKGCFLSVQRDTLRKIRVATVGGFVPLMAGIPTTSQAARMAEILSGDDWSTPLPVPTLNRFERRFTSGKPWRGDVWPATNYQVASGLARFGFKKLAAKIADTTIENTLSHGISEHYDSLTGEPLGVPGLGMSCTVLTMALDGISEQRRMSVL
ncbi:MAG: trehalase family glycosidase [Verrucomicrobiota bacterium]